MPVVALSEVQQWLEQRKLQLSQLDTELEATAQAVAFGKVSSVYTTTTWVDAAATPRLIRAAVAMYVAAWTYNRQYSEEDPDGSGYAQWLEGKADALLEAIAAGIIDLPEVADEAVLTTGQPSFYPTDTTETTYPEEARKFRVGQVF